MHYVFAHSDLEITDLIAQLPTESILMPCPTDDEIKAPFLFAVPGDSLAHVHALIKSVEATTGGQITSLPVPRSKAPLSDDQIAKVQTHIKKAKKGDTMADLLGYVFADCGSALFDPEIQCN